MILSLLDSLAVSFDLPILDWIQANMRNGIMDILMPLITYFGEDGIGWIAWAVILLLLKKHRKTGLGMAFALALGFVICNLTLKPMVGRIRPYDFQMEHFGITIKLLVEGLHDYSFPSGHTIASIEAAMVILLNNRKMGIPAMILALLIAFSRLYLYVHYPTDVIASLILGVVIALIANWLAGLIIKPARKGKYEK